MYPELQELQEDGASATVESVPQPLDVAPQLNHATVEAASPSSSEMGQSDSTAADAGVIFLPPLLRPATWSPINVTAGFSGLCTVRNSPSSVRSASSSSSNSLRTIPDEAPSSRFTLPIKTEYDHTLHPPFSNALWYSVRPQVEDRLLTPARVFLDGLRRPLGHATPHLHRLGVVTEADLDLVCTMPDAWDELGRLLRGSGVTMIEWFMVKEAFKTRAKRLAPST